MLRWIRGYLGRIAVLLLILLIGGFVYFVGVVRDHGKNVRFQPEVYEEIQAKLAERPYDGSLLLRAARHGVKMVRYHRKNPTGISLEELRDVIITALEAYHRLDASARWDFSSRDRFYTAYLFQQLGKIDSDVDYITRARQAAQRAYEGGYRSHELNTLLGNLYVNIGEYDLALNYYRSVGSTINDPVVLYNKAVAHRSRGQLKKAKELLARTYDMIKHGQRVDKKLLWKIREARLAIQIDRGQEDQVLAMLNENPEWLDRPVMKILQARALINRGQTTAARKQLEELVDVEPVARTARLLLQNLDDST